MDNREKIKWLSRYRQEQSRLRLLCAELETLRAQGRELCRARDGREDAPPPDWLARDLAQARQEMEAQGEQLQTEGVRLLALEVQEPAAEPERKGRLRGLQ